LPELRIVPDADVTARYAEASGDHNPIHLDEEFARSVGLPGRILHGLYTMALLARAQTQAAGGPGHLKRLSVQFRGTALPEEELTVSSTVSAREGDRVTTSATVTQRGRAIIRGASAELEL
jgi:acyl dehydratase